ncbi:MAG TPA: energy transducer TonB [Candidatus Angelobacter sp.]|jgi:periplasmic protein TonB|nr:energy transducer TonB [Candidatus Angelobacter sp.]
MFRESLLDSSPMRRNGKCWPMATAFALESIAAAVVIMIPLLSTGIIPVSAHPTHVAPLQMVRVAAEQPRGDAFHNSGPHGPAMTVVPVSTSSTVLHFGPPQPGTDSNVDPNLGTGSKVNGIPDVGACNTCIPIMQPPMHEKPVSLSHLSEAQLVHRVEPVYPRIAVVTGIQGEVKLHALIAKDGTIQSLSVSSGQPILAQAALDAVRQWRYRPYILNGQAVEVETFITVNFRKER